jgi:biotin carboxyl carrier protein
VKRRYAIKVGGASLAIDVEALDNGAVRVAIDGQERVIEPRTSGPGRYHWLEGTRVVTAEVEASGAKLSVAIGGQTIPVEVADARAVLLSEVAARASARPAGPVALRAPMPGRVVKILARAGESVRAGGGVVVVEAMKMENEIRAPRDATVKELRVAEGAAVEAGQELALLD